MSWQPIETAPRDDRFFIGANTEEAIVCNWSKQKNIDYAPPIGFAPPPGPASAGDRGVGGVMVRYENWFKDKERLNLLIDELNHLRNQMPSVHNDSIPVGESSQMWIALNAIEEAIHALEPLRVYKKPLPGGRV